MTLQFLTLLVASAGMALVGLTHGTNAVFFMFAAFVAVLLISYASSRLSPRALSWRREVIDRVFEHEPLTVSLELTNRGRLPRFMVAVSDTVPEFVEAKDPTEAIVPELWPGDRVTLSYEAQGLKRGAHRLGPLTVFVSDLFGVFQRHIALDALGEAVVYPRPVTLGAEVGRTGSDVRAVATAERARGSESGLDFYGIRDYQPGDELRRIHWPATAHHGRLTVIEFDRGASENVAVVLESRAGMEFGKGVDTTLEVGVRVAASLIHWVLGGEGIAFLATDSRTGPRCFAVDRLDREYEMLEVLARVEADGQLSAGELLDWAATSVPADAQIWIVTGAPDPDLPAVIGTLSQRQMGVGAVLVDAYSFDPRATPLSEVLRRARGPAGDARARHSGAGMVEALEAAGATTLVVRRGDDLRDVLADISAASD
jgi:uncharacterized protein (DUF58 family)